MNEAAPVPRAGARFAVEYHLSGPETEARAKAEALCLDQTVELPDELVPAGMIREQILGHVESFRRLNADRYEATISFPTKLLAGDCAQLLNITLGIARLKPGIRVGRLHLPDPLLQSWPGPRFGRERLRALVNVNHRTLACAVLKPLD